MACKWCGRKHVEFFPDSGVCFRCAAWFDGTIVHEHKKRTRMATTYRNLGLQMGKVWQLAKVGGVA